MYAERLKSLLSKGSISSENLSALSGLCHEWFTREPGIATYVLWQLFRGLDEMWCGEQVLAPEYPLFERNLVPPLTNVANQLIIRNDKGIVHSVEQLLTTYNECKQASSK
jgi:hypothetical protein